jgi:hypothetical protein
MAAQYPASMVGRLRARIQWFSLAGLKDTACGQAAHVTHW